MEFAGKTVLLTGAAGGLGVATSLAFMAAGAQLLAADIDEVKIVTLEGAAAKAGLTPRLTIERLDLADQVRLRDQVSALAERAGGIDVVVNNAAIYPSKLFEEYRLEEYQAVQKVNAEAAWLIAQAARPGMRAKGWGRIVNVASVTFYGGWSKLAPYIASKATLIGLTRAWASEFGPDGITVNAIAPGAFPTDAEKIHPDPEGYAAMVLGRQAVKRRGRPEDVAQALLFLASDRAAFITGQTLNVDGGWVMH